MVRWTLWRCTRAAHPCSGRPRLSGGGDPQKLLRQVQLYDSDSWFVVTISYRLLLETTRRYGKYRRHLTSSTRSVATHHRSISRLTAATTEARLYTCRSSVHRARETRENHVCDRVGTTTEQEHCQIAANTRGGASHDGGLRAMDYAQCIRAIYTSDDDSNDDDDDDDELMITLVLSKHCCYCGFVTTKCDSDFLRQTSPPFNISMYNGLKKYLHSRYSPLGI